MEIGANRFNPRARVGRDLSLFLECFGQSGVSIHAPAWGATKDAARSMSMRYGFNPRARVGRDK